MKKTVMSLVAFAAAVASAANTWWVAKEDPNASDSNPGTEALPFKTINAAANNPDIAANDTINVKPGVYDEGGQVDPQSGITNRVYLPVKIILHAVEGKEKTVIVGARDPKSADAYGRGPAAVRCVYATAADTRIEGFTIRDGVTNMDNADAYSSQGGGILAKDGTAGVYVLDCTITGCAAMKGGAIRGCAAIRCLVRDNWSSSTGSAGNGSLFACSVIDSNKGNTALSSCKTTNCTIVNNVGGTTGWSAHYNSIFSGNASDGIDSKAEHMDGSTTAADGDYQVMAPAVEDYRIVSGGAAIGKGDAKYFDRYIGLGKGWFEKDFAGQSLPTSGPVNAGAVQAVATPAAGGIKVKSGRDLVIDGKTAPAGSWAFPETYPRQWRVGAVSAADEYGVYSFSRDNSLGRIHPMPDGTAWIMPSPDPSVVITLSPNMAKRAFWVDPDPTRGSDDNAGTEAAPFRTLQKAVDAVGDNTATIVFAAAGDYNEGGKSLLEGAGVSGCTLTNRVCVPASRNILVRGAGVGQSFITGAADPTTKGNGPAAVRPVASWSDGFVVQGFTIRGGYSDLETAAKTTDKSAGVVGSSKGCVYVLDCAVTGNAGTEAVISGASVHRTTVTGNTPPHSVVDKCVMSACLIADNATLNQNSYIGQDCNLYGSTVRGISSNVGILANYVNAYGCLLDTSKTSYAGDVVKGTVCWNYADFAAIVGTEWFKAEPCFADPANGDYRIRSLSPAVSCIGVPTTSNYGAEYFKQAQGDLERNPVVSAIPVPGCYQSTVASPGVYVRAEKGGLSAAAGYTAVTEGAPVTVTLGAGTRPCVGYLANGETNLFAQVPLRTFTAADVGETGFYLEAIYSSDWYVNVAAADDAGYAYTPASAKKTFTGLFGTGLVLAGDTVHVAAGTYDQEVMFQDAVATVGARLVVPKGVTVVADEGAERTKLVGAAATVEPDESGRGANAVRCAFLRSGATLRGFTLRNGHTGCYYSGTDDAKTYFENIGGGVSGADEDNAGNQRVEDCILTGNAAYRGGGACYVTLKGCRVIGNAAVNGSGTFKCFHYGTVVNANSGNFGVMLPYSFVSSTVGPTHTGSWPFFVYAGDSRVIENSIIIGECQLSKSVALSTFFTQSPEAAALGAGCEVCDAADLRLDADCRPVIGSCRAVDRGDLSLYDTAKCGEKDASGGQRVYNAKLDAGALEGDWRPVYARDLCRGSGFAVTAADADVVETDDGTVSVASGLGLDATWASRTTGPTDYEIRFKVSGSGVLVVTFNGVSREFAASDDVQTCKVTSAEALNRLTFAYAGGAADDAAEILNCRRNVGMALIIR